MFLQFRKRISKNIHDGTVSKHRWKYSWNTFFIQVHSQQTIFTALRYKSVAMYYLLPMRQWWFQGKAKTLTVSTFKQVLKIIAKPSTIQTRHSAFLKFYFKFWNSTSVTHLSTSSLKILHNQDHLLYQITLAFRIQIFSKFHFWSTELYLYFLRLFWH